MKFSVTFSLGLALVAGPALAADVELAGMKSKTPASWKQEEPSNTFRLTQFKLPKADGDKEDAELAVFMLKGGGSIEDNLKRQEAKFKPADGAKLDSKTEKIKVGKMEATLQDVKGTFLSKFPPFAPNAKITEKPGYRQLYVVFGDYYMTLLGPAKTIEKHEKEFKEWLANFK